MDEENLVLFIASPVTIVSLIIGLAEIAKKLEVDPMLIPLVDLGLGLFFGVAYYGFCCGHGLIKGIIIGIALGLNACGLFSGLKNIFGGR